MGEDGERCSCEMASEVGRCERRIAARGRLEDGFVLVGGDRQGARYALDVEPPVPIGVVVELADGAHQAIAGVREQREVKFAIDALPLAKVVAGEGLHAAEAAAQRLDVAFGEARHVDADRQRLVDDAHGVELLEVVDRKRGDAAAPVHLGFDEPLALQHADGLAKGTAADAKLARELNLGERFSRRQRAVQDRLAQAAVDRPRHVARLARAVGSRGASARREVWLWLGAVGCGACRRLGGFRSRLRRV